MMNLSLSVAIEATEHLTLRELATHVHVWPRSNRHHDTVQAASGRVYCSYVHILFVFPSLLGPWGPRASSTDPTASQCFFSNCLSRFFHPTSPAIKHLVDVVYDVECRSQLGQCGQPESYHPRSCLG